MKKNKNRKSNPSGKLRDFSGIENNIFNFLKKKRNKSYTARELSRSLNINKTNYHLFRDALNSLAKKGSIIKLKGGRYSLPSLLKKVTGNLQLTRKGFGFVMDDRTGEEIFIPAQYLNTAFDGDLVEVQIFAVSRGKSKEGQISGILKRARTTFVGTYHKSEYYGFVVPDNPKVSRDFYIQKANKSDARDGQKVVVEFLKWESSALNPEGKIVEIIGFPDEAGVDIVSIVRDFELPIKFPESVEREAGEISIDFNEKFLAGRLDLRDELIFTIDPEDAKDFDDAVSLEKLVNGNYRLGVHIADVSYFVKDKSEIDKEALLRGTSIYLVDRVVPMLPERLSNELCSLQPDKPRLTMSCIMEIDPAGEVKNYRLEESVIQSKRRFSYEEAQSLIDDEKANDPFSVKLKEMRDLSLKLAALRKAMGSIDFETPEVKFKLDEKGKPVEIFPVEHLQTHQLIEEFMLLANQTVAKHVRRLNWTEKAPPFIFRVHERPDADKISNFQIFLNALGHKVKIPKNVTPKQFQDILEEVSGSPDDILIREVALRTMMKANYSTKNIGHFGLAFEDYTHFTSPIRRYPDLEVHRLIKRYRKSQPPHYLRELKSRLKTNSEISSDRERVALEAERESIKIKQVEWIAQHIDKTFDGIISGVTAFGIFVEITTYLIEGLIRLENMLDDYYIYDEKTYSLMGKEFEKVYRLGDPVKIKVKNVNLENRQIDFELLDSDNS